MDDFKFPPGASGATLVELSCWSDGGYNYSTYVKCKNGIYYFQGRERVGSGRHMFFPRKDWATIEIGEKEDAKSFLRSILNAKGCPEPMIQTVFLKMDR